MTGKKTGLTIPDEVVISKIYLVRGQKVMLDRDLARLYGVDTKHLKRQVSRNLQRFPPDFMFKLNKMEFSDWRSQFGTSNAAEKMGLRYAPFAFTEHGVLMLSSVLNSVKAIGINIQIMRVFTRVRQALSDNTELRLAIEKLEKKTDINAKNIETVFQYIDELSSKGPGTQKRKRIGYKLPEKK